MPRQIVCSRYAAFFGLLLCAVAFSPLKAADLATPPAVNQSLQRLREQSALDGAIPHITSIESNGSPIWMEGQREPAQVTAETWIVVKGSGLGQGPDVDYAKIVFGHSRVMERDLPMFEGNVLLLKKLFVESSTLFDGWRREIRSWTPTRIELMVPLTASEGPLAIQVQKRIGANASLQDPSTTFTLWDPLTERIPSGNFPRVGDVVSILGNPRISNLIPLTVFNPNFETLRSDGEKIFWSYDFNLGLIHHMAHLDWSAILDGKAIDPVTGKAADPEALFGAIPLRKGEVPDAVLNPISFEHFPTPMPLKPLLRPPLLSGKSYPSKYVGYVYVESIDPVRNTKGKWAGMTCVSCHSNRLTYEASPGKMVSQVFPGIPNPRWSMKWATLGNMYGVTGKEEGLDGKNKAVDKTRLLYAVPSGGGEHTLVRPANDGSIYGNDHLWSPITIPIITRHTPVRRALSRTEMIAGFEGSYIHSQEPDGAMGAMRSDALKSLTAYMTSLDKDNTTLENLGLYRWLKQTNRLDQVSNASEGEFMEKGHVSYPRVMERVEKGQQAFQRDCQQCHTNNFGTWTDENMYPVTEVGSYFSRTLYQHQTQSIRTSILHNMFWVSQRGLLHDGHVKSLEDLVNPERCREGSDLYNQYYTLHSGTFHIPKGNASQETALRNQAYFVDVPWDKSSLYWDYQGMRQAFGPLEYGTKTTTPLPASPHPWCARDEADTADLVEFLLTL